MKPISSYKNRTLLWEELAPSEDSRSRPGDYSAQPESALVSAPRPRLGFARRTTENLDPAYTPDPITLDEQDDDDFRPRRAAWWRPRTKTGRNVLFSASALALILLAVAGFFLRRHILNDPNFVEPIRRMEITLAVGEQDPFHESNRVLSQALADKDVPHRFAVWPGEAHRARYWREMVPHYL